MTLTCATAPVGTVKLDVAIFGRVNDEGNKQYDEQATRTEIGLNKKPFREVSLRQVIYAATRTVAEPPCEHAQVVPPLPLRLADCGSLD